MKKVIFLLIISIFTNIHAQDSLKNVSIKINYISYMDGNIHYKMPVLVELRNGDNLKNSVIVSQNTGIINADGVVDINFSDAPNGDYWILVRASGFLPVCSQNKQTLSTSGIEYDFTTSSDQAVLGTYAMIENNGIWKVRSGDSDGDGAIGAFDINDLLPNLGKSVKSSYPANDIVEPEIVYDSLIIGDQVWMTKNLDVVKYRNGDYIYHATNSNDWNNAGQNGIGAWCYYNHDSTNGEVYGKLYNWYAITDERGLTPEGWSIPTDDDWKELEMYLGMSAYEANKTNWRGTSEGSELAGSFDLWDDGDLRNHIDFDSSGFNGLPGGQISDIGVFMSKGNSAFWWTTTEYDVTRVYYRRLISIYTKVNRNITSKKNGLSIRCIK